MSEPRVIEEYRSLEARVLDAMDSSLSDVEFSELALSIFEFQCKWNEAYRGFAAGVPLPQTWREIPAVPQAAFKRSRLSCVPPNEVSTVFRTSGTTGETRGEHHFFNSHLYDNAILRGWDLLRLPRLPLRIIARRSEDAPDSSLSHMFGVLARERDAGNTEWLIDHDGSLDVDGFMGSLENAGPVTLLGTALGFLNLFEKLGNQPITLAAGSFALETGGYKGSGRELTKPELYEMFGEFFGLSQEMVINEYGMTELSSQFYTRELDLPHAAPPWLKALVIDPETGREASIGQTGILRIFDLANLNSAIAIETQDLAIRSEGGFQLLGRDPAALPRGCSRSADELLRR